MQNLQQAGQEAPPRPIVSPSLCHSISSSSFSFLLYLLRLCPLHWLCAVTAAVGCPTRTVLRDTAWRPDRCIHARSCRTAGKDRQAQNKRQRRVGGATSLPHLQVSGCVLHLRVQVGVCDSVPVPFLGA